MTKPAPHQHDAFESLGNGSTEVWDFQGKKWVKEVLKTRPFGRMLAPADIARAALFFARNELVSGAVLDYEQMPVGTLREP